MPPARLTAAATSRQWVKAKMGNSMPNISHRRFCMVADLLTRTCSSPPPDLGVNYGHRCRASRRVRGRRGLERAGLYEAVDLPAVHPEEVAADVSRVLSETGRLFLHRVEHASGSKARAFERDGPEVLLLDGDGVAGRPQVFVVELVAAGQ